jgi:hypothetical protein
VQLLMFASLAVMVLMKSGIYPPELVRVNLDFDVFTRLAGRWGLLRLRGRLTRWSESLSELVLDRIPALVVESSALSERISPRWLLVLPSLLLVLLLLIFLIANLYS